MVGPEEAGRDAGLMRRGTVRLPVGKVEQGRVVGSEERPLRLDIKRDYPLALSFVCLQDTLLADPSQEEEALAVAALSVVGSADGLGKLWQLHKPGGTALADDVIREAMSRASDYFAEVSGLIDAAVTGA